MLPRSRSSGQVTDNQERLAIFDRRNGRTTRGLVGTGSRQPRAPARTAANTDAPSCMDNTNTAMCGLVATIRRVVSIPRAQAGRGPRTGGQQALLRTIARHPALVFMVIGLGAGFLTAAIRHTAEADVLPFGLPLHGSLRGLFGAGFGAFLVTGALRGARRRC